MSAKRNKIEKPLMKGFEEVKAPHVLKLVHDDDLVLQLAKFNYLVLQLAGDVQVWSWTNHKLPTGLCWPGLVCARIFAKKLPFVQSKLQDSHLN